MSTTRTNINAFITIPDVVCDQVLSDAIFNNVLSNHEALKARGETVINLQAPQPYGREFRALFGVGGVEDQKIRFHTSQPISLNAENPGWANYLLFMNWRYGQTMVDDGATNYALQLEQIDVSYVPDNGAGVPQQLFSSQVGVVASDGNTYSQNPTGDEHSICLIGTITTPPGVGSGELINLNIDMSWKAPLFGAPGDPNVVPDGTTLNIGNDGSGLDYQGTRKIMLKLYG